MYNFLKTDKKTELPVAEKITELEQKYGIEFPAVYKAYLREYNDMPIKRVLISVNGCDYDVKNIVAVLSDGLTFETIVDWGREGEYLEDPFYPIAKDTGGDSYCWDNETGKVYMVRCEEEDDKPEPICDSVEEFFEKLNQGKSF